MVETRTYILGACISENLYRERGNKVSSKVDQMYFSRRRATLWRVNIANDHNHDKVCNGKEGNE